MPVDKQEAPSRDPVDKIVAVEEDNLEAGILEGILEAGILEHHRDNRTLCSPSCRSFCFLRWQFL